MWSALKNLSGWYTQVPIGCSIVDFLHRPSSTVVEVDGKYHLAIVQQLNDAERTRVLSIRGFAVIRFTNEEVLGSIDAVMARLSAIINHREQLPSRATLRKTPAIAQEQQKKEPRLKYKRWNGRTFDRTATKPDVCSARIPGRKRHLQR